jgi:LPS export ABC transporter permease LptF/LPS export ABC transporter permease LptG
VDTVPPLPAELKPHVTLKEMDVLRLMRATLLDRYIIREIVPPTSLGLLVFTFILLINEIPRLLGVLVARQADAWTIFRVFFNLLPSIIAVTIPMAFLLGVLLAFGRMSSDSEMVALRASGVSPLRLIVPVLILSTATALVTFYVNAVAVPAANQVHRELVYKLVAERARTAVKPRTFTDKLLPGMMLFVSDIPADTGEWVNVLIHDRRGPPKSQLILSRAGRLVVDEAKRSVRVELGQGVRHTFDAMKPKDYDQEKFKSLVFALPLDEFFPKLTLSKSDREMTLGELSSEIRERLAKGEGRKETARFEVEWHKKFAISTACVVFGLLGLGLSLGNRKEARSAAFALSIAVIFVYYVLIRLGEQAGDTGLMPPFLSMWAANLVLGAAAIALLALNHREAAFDPLDARHYLSLLPSLRRERPAPRPRSRTAHTTMVVFRIPRITLRLRFPTLLDRYLARSYVGYLLLVLTAFLSLYVLVDFINNLFDDVRQHQVRMWTVLHYYLFYSVSIVHTVTPVAVLVAVLVTLGVLARRNEVTAMKAGGLSIYRITAPLLAMGLLVSATLFVLQEFVLPTTNRLAQVDKNVIRGFPPQATSLLERPWTLASDGRFYNYDYLVERTNPAEAGMRTTRSKDEFSLFGLSVYDIDPKNWELREYLYTRRAFWNAPTYGYDLDPGHRLTLRPNLLFRTFEASRVRALGHEPGGELEPPPHFKHENKPYEAMTFDELRRHIASVEAMGFDGVPLRVQLQRKLSFPMVGFIMTLLGVPFSFVVARRGALSGIGISIMIAILYWACLGTFEAFGNNAILPPPLASWAPNLIFGSAGLYLMLTLET